MNFLGTQPRITQVPPTRCSSATATLAPCAAATRAAGRLPGSAELRLRAAGYEVMDFGDRQLKPNDDYPDFVVALARSVAAGEVRHSIA